MYSLGLSRDFIARHYLIGGDWGPENQLHSHHYRLDLVIGGEDLDRHGYLIDLIDLDRAVTETIALFRDQTLNEIAEFAGANPSLERFARIIWRHVRSRLPEQVPNLRVKLWENDRDWAGYTA